MNNNKAELKTYLKSEYGTTSTAFLTSDIHHNSILDVLKSIRDVILFERSAYTVRPNSSAYLYFRDEYKDHISFERNNIIVPNTSDIRLTLKH